MSNCTYDILLHTRTGDALLELQKVKTRQDNIQLQKGDVFLLTRTATKDGGNCFQPREAVSHVMDNGTFKAALGMMPYMNQTPTRKRNCDPVRQQRHPDRRE